MLIAMSIAEVVGIGGTTKKALAVDIGISEPTIHQWLMKEREGLLIVLYDRDTKQLRITEHRELCDVVLLGGAV